MLYLNADTAAQTIYLSLDEGRGWLDSYTDYLIEIRSVQSGESFFLIADVQVENERYTEITIGTDTDDALNGAIEITEPGDYVYIVYGQNSTTNLSPTNAAVIGVVERGHLRISSAQDYFTEDTATVPDNIVA